VREVEKVVWSPGMLREDIKLFTDNNSRITRVSFIQFSVGGFSAAKEFRTSEDETEL